MKRFISLVLSLITLMSVMSFGFNAYADTSKFYEQREQYNTQKAYSGFYGSKLYFFENNEEKLYVKKGLNGKHRLVKSGICSDGISTMYKSYIYYIGEDGILYRCSLSGKKHTALVKNVYITDFIIANGRIVYRAEDPFGDLGVEGLYTCTLKGKDTKCITKNLASDYYSYKTCLYFIDVNSNTLKRYSLKKFTLTDVTLKKSLQDMKLLGMEGRSMYFLKQYKTVDKFFKVDVKTGVFTKIGVSKDAALLQKDVAYIVSRDNVYCTKSTKKKVKYCYLNKKAKKFDLIKSVPKGTTSGGAYMQFYKDKLVDIVYEDGYPTFKFVGIIKL